MKERRDMPFPHFALILTSVLVAAAATVWLLSIGGPGLLIAALPAALIAVVALKTLRR
jgi:hypothetical protein